MRRPRALFITYLYPPVGGMSPKVALNYSRALSRGGWDVDVVTPAPSDHHPVYKLDESLRGVEVENVRVHRTFPGPFYWLGCRAVRAGAGGARPVDRRRTGPPAPATNGAGRAARMRALYRALVRPWILPDGRADWLPWALAECRRLLARGRYDMLLTYGYPYTCHVVGLLLHRRRPMPWVIHHGDLWSFMPGLSLPRWRKSVDRRLEGAVLRRVSRVIVNTEAAVDGYADEFPEIPRSRFAVVPTGYDGPLYRCAVPERSSLLRLVYTGVIVDGVTAHLTLLDALAAARRRGAAELECLMAGNFPQALHDRAARCGLGDALEIRGFQPSRTIAGLQKGAGALVLFGMPGQFQVPSKLYEYYAARRPLLVIRAGDGDLAAADVERRRRGFVVDNEARRLTDALLRLHTLWKQGALDTEFDLAGVPALTWEVAGDRFLEAIAGVTVDDHG